ncbi:MAG: hypothetical protein U0797_09230 [Gemmataceae bacterium]
MPRARRVQPDSAETRRCSTGWPAASLPLWAASSSARAEPCNRSWELHHPDPRLRGRAGLPSDVVQEVHLEATRSRMDDYLSRRPMPVPPVAAQDGLRATAEPAARPHAAAAVGAARQAWPDRSSLLLARPLLGAEPSPSQEAVAREVAEAVARGVATLTEADQEVLLMQHAEDLPYEEDRLPAGHRRRAAQARYGRAARSGYRRRHERPRGCWSSCHERALGGGGRSRSIRAGGAGLRVRRAASGNGERPDVEEYVARHPEHAGMLRPVLVMLAGRAGGTVGRRRGGGPAGFRRRRDAGDFRIVREVGRAAWGGLRGGADLAAAAGGAEGAPVRRDVEQLQRFHNEAYAAASLHAH